MGDSDKLSELQTRVKQLVELLAGGSTRVFPEKFGSSHSTLSRIIKGHLEPTEGVLRTLGAIPEVNSNWLRTGEGEPIIQSSVASVPILSTLSASPSSNKREPERLHLGVPGNFASLYAIRAFNCVNESDFHALKIDESDLLVIDTDVSAWTARLSIGVEKLAIIELQDGLSLRFIRIDLEDGKRVVKTVLDSNMPRFRDSRQKAADAFREFGRELRSIEIPGDETTLSCFTKIDREAVVGRVARLERTF